MFVEEDVPLATAWGLFDALTFLTASSNSTVMQAFKIFLVVCPRPLRNAGPASHLRFSRP